eukprot:TRINITY_DN120_c0_g1_i7.p1 TRINITY_DN120_c0_g1~~TRINITY_DN120_c0_g1_i7.p1  ORF type:complete len:497 (+),score=115.83 TRINITY_DN120_c0_g1_i7:59-1549(+)
MAALVALLSLCVGALPPCPSWAGPECVFQIANPHTSTNFFQNLAVSPDGQWAVFLGRELSVFNIATGNILPLPALSVTPPSFSAAFSSDNSIMAVGETGMIVLSRATGATLWTGRPRHAVMGLVFSPDDSLLAGQTHSGVVVIWDAKTGAELKVFRNIGSEGAGIFFTPDGNRLVSGECFLGNSVQVWDVHTGALLREFVHPGGLTATAVSPNGEFLLTTTYSRVITVYSMKDYSTVYTFEEDHLPSMVSISADSSQFLVTGANRGVQMYSMLSGARLRFYPTPADFVLAAFLPNNDFVTARDAAKSEDVVPLLRWSPAPTAGPVQLVSASGTQDVAGVPVAGAEVPLPAGGLALSGVPASLQGSSTAHSTRVAVGEKLRLSCASGSCGFVVAVYACKRCADAANDFEAQMVADGYTQLTCAPMFSVAGGSTSGQYVMRAYHIPVTSNDPVELEAVVHATQHVVAFQLDSAMGVSPPSCPPNVFSGPSPPCLCVSP